MDEHREAKVARVRSLIRETQEAELVDSRRRLRVRNRLLAEPRRSGIWSRPALPLAAAVGSVAAALLIGLVLLRESPTALTFQTEGQPRESGEFVLAPPDRNVTLAFSDGSSVALSPNSGVRVDALREHGANVRLEHGSAEVDVAHQTNTEWELQGGPYTVHVVGTRFRVSWDTSRRTFELKMHEGQVEVAGPELATRRLRSGELLVVTSSGDGVTATRTPAPSSERVGASERIETSGDVQRVPHSLERSVEARAAGEAPGSRPSPDRPRAERRSTAAGPVPAPTALDGFESTLREGSEVELERLATQARRTSHPREPLVYKALRRRFAGTDAAAEAAFHHARWHVRQGNVTEATRGLQTYLLEQPHGPWAREAAGRIVELLQASGQESEARIHAARYLERYPQGPHADFARRIRDR